MLLSESDRAYVDRSKITEYSLSLSHADGHTKAAFFMRIGFRAERWEELAEALRLVGVSNPATRAEQSVHGVATLWTVCSRLRTGGRRRCAQFGSWRPKVAARG